MIKFILLVAVCTASAQMLNLFLSENTIDNDVEDVKAMSYSQQDDEKKKGCSKCSRKYEPTWKDLDQRPLPRWYDEAKIGIFLHWGVYSVPSYRSEWFWFGWQGRGDRDLKKFMAKNYPPGFTYQQFAPMFTAEFFDPDAWAELFLRAGAKYLVLTSKHHEGFTMFPSKTSFSWNSVNVGPHRDIVEELATAVRARGLKFGVYHSLYEWFNPMYLEDKAANFTTFKYRDNKLWPDLKQLVMDYKPSILWSDGDWETDCTYWDSTGFLAWLYNDSPVKDHIVVNDRWGRGTPGHHGDFYNFDDRYDPGVLIKHKWESAFTIDKTSWGYRRNIDLASILTTEELLQIVIRTVSCGGNALINVGPTKEGTIIPIFQERLMELGDWLHINAEAIYSTSPWLSQNDTLNGKVWYTCTKAKYNYAQPTALPQKTDEITAIYAIATKWPENGILKLSDVTSELHSGQYNVQLLGDKRNLKWQITSGVTHIELPDKATILSKHAWALKFTHK